MYSGQSMEVMYFGADLMSIVLVRQRYVEITLINGVLMGADN